MFADSCDPEFCTCTSHDDYQEVLNSRFPGHLAEEDTTHETISVMSIDEDPSQPEATEPTVEEEEEKAASASCTEQ